MQLLFTFIVGLFIAYACSHYAKKRGRNPLHWFIGGALFGIFALITLFLLPNRHRIKPYQATVPKVEKVPSVPLLKVLVETQAKKPWYYLDQDKKQYGPMSFEALRNALEEGKLHFNTYVWNEELEEWKRLKELVDAPSVQ